MSGAAKRTFQYRAADRVGKTVSGDMTAASRAELFDRLQEAGLTLIDAREGGAASASGLADIFTRARGNRFSRRELAHFFRTLSTFGASGITIDRALRLFAKLRDGSPVGALAQEAAEGVRAGKALSAVLAPEDARLPAFVVPMIETGEISGTTPAMMAEIADVLDRQQSFEDEIVGALTYPAVLLLTAIAAVVVITTIVLPQFKPLFDQAGATMPWISSVFLGFADFVSQFGLWVLAALALAAVGAVFALREEAWRRRLDAALLATPLVGDLVAKMNYARFFRGFGLLLTAGVALPRALRVARKGTGNRLIADALERAERGVREGEALSALIAREPTAPRIAADFLTVGEESGQIGPVSANLAALLSADIARWTNRFLKILSPAITLVLGLFVAGLVASILLALLSINDLAF